MTEVEHTLITIAKLALEAVTLEVSPPPATEPERAELLVTKRHYKRRQKPEPKKVAKPGAAKRAGFPPGSRFFDCEDCKMGFASTESPMDAQCKHCGSFHVHLREKKSDQSPSTN
jgi:DNA-directed RNA polymerase subunit RPC12/RpoP